MAFWAPSHRTASWFSRYRFVESVFALSLLGVVPVPINTRLQPPEIAYVVGHARLRAVVTVPGEALEPDFPDLLARSLREAPPGSDAVRSIVLSDTASENPIDWADLEWAGANGMPVPSAALSTLPDGGW